MKFDSSSMPTPPTPQQLTELNDVLVSATELQQIYAGLAQHPRVVKTPGSSEIFESCLEQVGQDIAVLEEQLESLQALARLAPAEVEQESENALPGAGGIAAARLSFPDVQRTDPQNSVFVTVRRGFHLEDFMRQQLVISLHSAQQRQHLKLELQLKMILLSAEQRCRLLEERYGFARSKSLLFQGLRKQTTRFLSKLQGEQRHDID
jgi:hypothetical protein